MKKRLLPIAVLMLTGTTYSQIGIGTMKPHDSAMLEINSADKGVVIPQISLKSTTDELTIKNAVESLLVYNVNTSADIVPGYYYWNKAQRKWIKVVSSTDLDAFDSRSNKNLYVENDTLFLKDSKGDTVSILLEKIQVNTSLINDPTSPGNFIFTDEKGNKNNIPVLDVIRDNFDSIVSNDKVVQSIIDKLAHTYGNVYYDKKANAFYYKDGSNQLQSIVWSDFDTKVASYKLQGDELVITDSENTEFAVKLEDIANNSKFVTTLANNNHFVTELSSNDTFVKNVASN
ncbi:hypothetical protein GJV76_14585, partial [Myroides sp. BIT-d1]|nr:hypothetical protein [Myroides albus]